MTVKLGNLEPCISHFEKALIHAKLQENDLLIAAIQKVQSDLILFQRTHLSSIGKHNLLTCIILRRLLMKQSYVCQNEDAKHRIRQDKINRELLSDHLNELTNERTNNIFTLISDFL